MLFGSKTVLRAESKRKRLCSATTTGCNEQLSDIVLRQQDFGELQYTLMNGFEVPITITRVTLENPPTCNVKVGVRTIPLPAALQPGQSLTTPFHVGTEMEGTPQRYSFEDKVLMKRRTECRVVFGEALIELCSCDRNSQQLASRSPLGC